MPVRRVQEPGVGSKCFGHPRMRPVGSGELTIAATVAARSMLAASASGWRLPISRVMLAGKVEDGQRALDQPNLSRPGGATSPHSLT